MNIIIQNGNIQPNDAKCLFLDEPVINVQPQDTQTLLVSPGIYKSKTKAVADGRSGPIPLGFTKYKANKRTTLWIWNPSE